MNTTQKEISIPALRGNIYDRNGKLIAGNRVVYSVAITDLNYYTKSDGAFNEMLLRLIKILDKYEVSVSDSLPVMLTSEGTYEYKGSESKIRLFIRDVYGLERIREWEKEGVDAYSFDAEKVMSYLMKNLYNFTSKWKNGETLSKEQVLKICHIRYLLAATSYTRYISTKVAVDVSENVRAAIYESASDLLGVSIEESYVRDYKESKCFSSILGYVGSITQDEIEDLNAKGGDYIAGDLVGKQGIEEAYEEYLQGTKGKKRIFVNSLGMVLSEEILSEPVPGHDVYLSVDFDMTVAAYNVMEQQLAGVVVSHLYSGNDYDPEIAYKESNYRIPIRDVYFQMINNNVLNMRSFSLPDASESMKSMEMKRMEKKEEVIRFLTSYLKEKNAEPLSSLSSYEAAYVRYFSTYLGNESYWMKDAMDTTSEIYTNWSEGNISFCEFLMGALRNGWVNMSKLEAEDRYHSVEDCYDALTVILLNVVAFDYGEFDKLIYNELIHEDIITGSEVARALFDEGVLTEDTASYNKLSDTSYAFTFFEEKIQSMEITPAEIALDPCSGGLVLTDPNTGELLTCISYPGYDLNRMMDSSYYVSLLNDLSSPLYSRATQSRLAPGSTFKMITAIAALESGYLGYEDKLTCEGIFGKLDHPRCWIYRLQNGQHGDLDVVHGLAQSCNCFFYELGYRFSQNAAGAYSPSTGISVLNDYAKKFGFGTLSGVETEENVSILTTELPVTSAIGQGTNAFTTISLARYVTAIASSGNVYEFRLLNHIENMHHETVLSYTPKVERHLEFRSMTWDLIHQGMYMVVHEGGSRNGDFIGLRYQYAAKSGSAQENRLRAEHGWYVTYGPYNDISWAIAVQIPNGYSAGNAALVAKGLYEFLEGDITLEEILQKSAAQGSAVYIPD